MQHNWIGCFEFLSLFLDLAVVFRRQYEQCFFFNTNTAIYAQKEHFGDVFVFFMVFRLFRIHSLGKACIVHLTLFAFFSFFQTL